MEVIVNDYFDIVSTASGGFKLNFRYLILVTDGWCILCEIALRWMAEDRTDSQSTLFQVMTCCYQQQAFILGNVDPDICRHVALLRHGEMNGNG